MIPLSRTLRSTFSAYQLIKLAARTNSATASLPSIQHRRLYQRQQAPRQIIIAGGGSEGGQRFSSSSPFSVARLNEFDPPAQISKIDTHYCREPQLVMLEGYGIIQGQMDSSRLLTKYLNIPFATVQDPNKHAIAPDSWSGIRDATVLGAMCPQDVQESNSLTTMMLGLPGPGFEFSERDCLNLNVFAPRLVEHVPVICYIHGGQTHGGNALPKNNATNIVKKSIAKDMPVVVVTINYRLLPSAGLLEAPPQDLQQSGQNKEERVDWGLYDQKIALEWVRRHIHNFGGNPNEITLMGHSNGASSAGYHMLTAQHEGLFKRAIMHSGSRDTGSRTEQGEAREPAYPTSSKEVLQTAHSVSAVTGNGRVEEEAADGAASFTFMSDACTPYMGEREKQAGLAVIDRWIDFAWGKDSTAADI